MGGRREATSEGRLRRIGGKRHEFRKHLLNHAAFRGLFLVTSPDNSENPDAREIYPQHECGLFGVFGHHNAAVLTYYGLFALQHRGQESAGIVTSNGPGTSFVSHKDMGLVSQVFGQAELERLKGGRAIGHTRYSTTGTSTIKNAQPFVVDCVRGQMAIGHNGNLINADVLRDELERKGSIFQTTADSEIILHLLAQPTDNGGNTLAALRRIEGAFSLLIMSERELIAVRDPFGWRPLSLGKLDNAYILASETCAFDLIHAEFVRNHYIGRTFLQPSQLIRDFDVRVKLNLIKEMVAGKRVVVVDDSIVRGTTARARVVNLREAGAKEVHMRVSCPPHRFACHYGIDFPDPQKLIANQMSMEEIRKYLGVDSLGYLDVEGMVRATGRPVNEFCLACFTGNYPLPVDPALDKFIMEKRENRSRALLDQERHPTLFADLK